MSPSLRRKIESYNEITPLMLTSILGVLIMISGNDLLTIYLGLELSSFAVYILAISSNPSAFSLEAGMKYFVLGAVSSGLILFGGSLLYGVTGTISLPEISIILRHLKYIVTQEAYMHTIFFASLLILAGFAFKMGIAPFHTWVPDVYQGAPRHTVVFLSLVPKIAYFTVIIRFAYEVIQQRAIFSFLTLIGVISLIVGSIGGINQSNILRIMGYSSIANLGTLFIVLGIGRPYALSVALFYFLIYILLNITFFGILITFIGYKGYVLTSLNDMAFVRSDPLLSALIALNMFSNAGFPPFAGFYGKLYIGLLLLQIKAYGLFILLFVCSVFSCYYYVRFIALIYFGNEDNAPEYHGMLQSQRLFFVVLTNINFILLMFIQNPLLIICENLMITCLFN